MTLRHTFACEAPIKLAEFWRAALGYEHLQLPTDFQAKIDEELAPGKLGPTAWAMLIPPDGQ